MKILIVEDEHKIANSVKKGFELEGFAVDVAYDGVDGYDFASSEGYDVIILDLMLPGISGNEICRRLRKEGNNTPILILTAKGELSDKVEGLNRGADDYLVKPFAFSELLARVRALSRRPEASLGTKLKVGPLSLDTISYEVRRSKKSIKLTKKEFALLEYLMRHAGKILSKEMIMSNVWSYDDDILPNTVEVFMGYLRKKIDAPFSNEPNLIHTIRGFGYKLESK
jgi:DNA-binding response OmpR family regulator